MTTNETKLVSFLDEAYNEGFTKGTAQSQSGSFIPIGLKEMANLIVNKTYVKDKIYIVEES